MSSKLTDQPLSEIPSSSLDLWAGMMCKAEKILQDLLNVFGVLFKERAVSDAYFHVLQLYSGMGERPGVCCSLEKAEKEAERTSLT